MINIKSPTLNRKPVVQRVSPKADSSKMSNKNDPEK
jgi:hypothetical protein